MPLPNLLPTPKIIRKISDGEKQLLAILDWNRFLIYSTYALSRRICLLEFSIVLDPYYSNGQNESVPNSWLIKFRVPNINDNATFIKYGLSVTA